MMKVVEEYNDARVTHEFEEMTREKRPQDDPERNGKGLNFQTSEHGGKHPDTMPQALKITDRDGRSCTFEPKDELPADARPQDPSLRGSGLKFQVLEYGGEYNDNMPISIRLTDGEGRSCVYVPITVDGRVVDSKGFTLETLPKESKRRTTRAKA
jgi:hypothetical protein